MSKEVARNGFSIIFSHAGFLELRWLPSSAGLDDEAFASTLRWFAAEADRARPRGLLSDAVNLRFKPTEPMMAWRRAQIVPRYGQAGVQRFAFLVAPDHPHAGTETFEDPAAAFPTRWFTDRDAAVAWLLSIPTTS